MSEGLKEEGEEAPCTHASVSTRPLLHALSPCATGQMCHRSDIPQHTALHKSPVLPEGCVLLEGAGTETLGVYAGV